MLAKYINKNWSNHYVLLCTVIDRRVYIYIYIPFQMGLAWRQDCDGNCVLREMIYSNSKIKNKTCQNFMTVYNYIKPTHCKFDIIAALDCIFWVVHPLKKKLQYYYYFYYNTDTLQKLVLFFISASGLWRVCNSERCTADFTVQIPLTEACIILDVTVLIHQTWHMESGISCSVQSLNLKTGVWKTHPFCLYKSSASDLNLTCVWTQIGHMQVCFIFALIDNKRRIVCC